MFIGPREIKGEPVEAENLVTVEYKDGTSEILSKLMYDITLSKKACDLTELMEKRIKPIVKETLTIMRNYGMKLSEVSHFLKFITEMLEINEEAAIVELWKPLNKTIQRSDDIDLISIDKVLKSKNDK